VLVLAYHQRCHAVGPAVFRRGMSAFGAAADPSPRSPYVRCAEGAVRGVGGVQCRAVGFGQPVGARIRSCQVSEAGATVLRMYGACVAVAAELSLDSPALLRRMLSPLLKHPTRAYPGREDDGHIHICRLFMFAVGATDTDNPEDWAAYRCCSRHVAQAFRLYNICTQEDALAARAFMRRMLGIPEYLLSDLTAPVCLASSKRCRATTKRSKARRAVSNEK